MFQKTQRLSVQECLGDCGGDLACCPQATLQPAIADPTGALLALQKAAQTVPLAVAYVSEDYHGAHQAKQRAPPLRKRSYADWFSVFDAVLPSRGRAWAPVWGLRIPPRGPFLVHSEGEGRSSCVGFSVVEGGSLRVYDGGQVLLVGADHAREAYAEATDHSTIVTFAPEPCGDRAAAPRFALLGLRAA